MARDRTTLPFADKEANDSSGFLLWRLTTLWQRAISAALRPYGITQVQFVLLASLLWLQSKGEHITQAGLCRHTKLDKMMISQVLRTLESRGMVTRDAHPTDTRARTLKLTKSGKNMAITAIPIVEAIDKNFFAATGSKRSDLNRCLLEIIQKNDSTL